MDESLRDILRPDGAVVRVETEGQGPPLVLLHGSLTGRSAFARLRPHLDGHQLVLPVQRGHDNTPAVFPDGYGLDRTEVDDLVAVLDELGLAEVDIVGHSTGGAIGLAFALQHPERARRLVMIEPTVFSLLPPAIASEVWHACEVTVAHAQRGDHRAAVASLLQTIGGDDWTSLPETAKDKTLDALAEVAEVAGPHVQALLDLDVTEAHVSTLSLPTLLIYGDTTIFFEPHIAARFAELRPDIEQIVIEGASHNSQVDHPEIVGRRVTAFLASEGS